MAKGKHLGSFAGGFMEGLLGVMKMQMMQMHYAALQKHYDALDDHYKRAEAFERFKYLHGEEYGKWEAGNRGAAGFEETVGNVPGGGGGGVAGNAAELRDFYVSQGYTPEGAAAIVGNWQQENSLKGGGWGGDSGTSAGGFQWHDDPSKGLYRGTGFMNWAKENNLNVNDPMTSAKYSIVDIKNNFKDLDRYLRTTHDVDEATQKFEKDFEGASTPVMENRLSAARAVNALKTAAPATATATTKPPPAASAHGGVPVKYNGKEYDTDKDGNILPDTGRPITTSQADTGRTSYQVAGDVPIALTEEAGEEGARQTWRHTGRVVMVGYFIPRISSLGVLVNRLGMFP